MLHKSVGKGQWWNPVHDHGLEPPMRSDTATHLDKWYEAKRVSGMVWIEERRSPHGDRRGNSTKD